ncbi:uncharacterized protein METZ01_LOCUS436502, partial [marine metagenome]
VGALFAVRVFMALSVRTVTIVSPTYYLEEGTNARYSATNSHIGVWGHVGFGSWFCLGARLAHGTR